MAAASVRFLRDRAPAPNWRPLRVELLAQIVAPIGTETLADLRDRAILLLGFAGALRRSELAALKSGRPLMMARSRVANQPPPSQRLIWRRELMGNSLESEPF